MLCQGHLDLLASLSSVAAFDTFILYNYVLGAIVLFDMCNSIQIKYTHGALLGTPDASCIKFVCFRCSFFGFSIQ